MILINVFIIVQMMISINMNIMENVIQIVQMDIFILIMP